MLSVRVIVESEVDTLAAVFPVTASSLTLGGRS
jgi:hypothetical protein